MIEKEPLPDAPPALTGDALIDEVRMLRWRASAAHGHDLEKHFLALREMDKKARAAGRRVVTVEELRRRPKAG